jgi:hypothetical protein
MATPAAVVQAADRIAATVRAAGAVLLGLPGEELLEPALPIACSRPAGSWHAPCPLRTAGRLPAGLGSHNAKLGAQVRALPGRRPAIDEPMMTAHGPPPPSRSLIDGSATVSGQIPRTGWGTRAPSRSY